MSRPKHYWYGHIKRTISRYPNGLNDGSVQSCIAKGAIEKALDDTYTRYPDGELRVKLIESVCFKKTHTVDGAADMLFISKRTAVRWMHSFIYSVARKMGYM